MVDRVGGVCDRRGRMVSAAVAGVYLTGGVEACDAGEAGKRRLRAVGESHARVYAAAERGGVHLRGKYTRLCRDEGEVLPGSSRSGDGQAGRRPGSLSRG